MNINALEFWPETSADRLVGYTPGHYQNLMSSRYTLTGLGVAFGSVDGEEYAVLVTHKLC